MPYLLDSDVFIQAKNLHGGLERARFVLGRFA
jgi:hypothetical protein